MEQIKFSFIQDLLLNVSDCLQRILLNAQTALRHTLASSLATVLRTSRIGAMYVDQTGSSLHD